mgnify:CR=1 FL=1
MKTSFEPGDIFLFLNFSEIFDTFLNFLSIIRVQNMCQVIEEYGDERAAEALKQGKIEAARNFLANGVSIEIIAKSLNMSVAEIEEIVKHS